MPDEQWQELSPDECQALLGGSHLGRIALVEGGRPLILPVNYVLDDKTVVFRTDQGTKLDAAVRGAPVAFEVDGVNSERRTGWSVLVRGRAEHVTDRTELERLRRLPLVPLAPGAKPHYVRVKADEVTGRRISVANLPSNWWG
jgi:nitroimidazol reductase NimA-like FMN-containing flavoprotein (pyridoxamine 5'-phosphate oxidase superfamily)